MALDFGFALNDGDFYTRPEHTARRNPYLPADAPQTWDARSQGIWTVWTPPALTTQRAALKTAASRAASRSATREGMPAQGWKVHVSARYSRAQHVLDQVAAACFAAGVPFKHLASEQFFLYLHNKHGPRVQSGKFCVCYPSGPDAARRLMDELSAALAGEEGPFVLTDRRYGDSQTVHYRYGAFAPTGRLRPDGSTELTVRDDQGQHVPDERAPRFVLPAGVVDPFAPPQEPTQSGGPVLLRGYEVTTAIAQSNSGGAYRGVELATCRTVFLKEARRHNGLHWDGVDSQTRLRHEYEMLRALHELEPGVAPEPLAHFTEWENDFLVTELVAGQSLAAWSARQNPVITADRSPAAFAAYHRQCRHVLTQLADALERMHRHGYVFGDINPANVLVAGDGAARLIDFEATTHAAQPPSSIGTPGFSPSTEPDLDDRSARDRYGLSALALYLLWPLNHVAERNPAGLAHLRADLERFAPVPADLWALATEFCPPAAATASFPAPADVAADPHRQLSPGRGSAQAGHDGREAQPRAGLAGRGVVGRVAAGCGRSERGVPELLRLGPRAGPWN